MSSTLRRPGPRTGPLPKVGPQLAMMGAGGFHALESWLYDHDYVDLERRRAAFLGARRGPHTPPGVPTMVRELGRRQIHIISGAATVSCEYQRINEKAARVGGPSRTRV